MLAQTKKRAENADRRFDDLAQKTVFVLNADKRENPYDFSIEQVTC